MANRRLELLVCALFTALAAGCGGSGGGGTGGGGTGGTSGGSGSTTSSGNLPAPVAPLTGTRETWDVFSYIVPTGMTEQQHPDGIVLQDSTTSDCTISLLAARASTGNLPQQALDTFVSWGSPTIAGLQDEYGGSAPLNFQRRAITPTGFSSITLMGYAVNSSGSQLADARIMLVDVGAQVAPVIALGSCFNALGDSNLDWAWLFHGLDFPGATPTGSTTLAAQVVGKWQYNSGTAFLGEVYAANQQYSVTASSQTYSQVSSTEVLQTTTTFVGDGTWEAHQDRLTRLPSSGGGTTRLFRIQEEMNSAAPNGWLMVLLQIDVSSSDGKPYEYALTRDGQ